MKIYIDRKLSCIFQLFSLLKIKKNIYLEYIFHQEKVMIH